MKRIRLKSSLDYFIPEGLKSFIYWFLYKIKYRKCQIKSGTKISRYVILNDGVQIGKMASISGVCEVGSHTFINDYSLLDSSVVSIGRFCSISHNVKIGMRSHPTKLFSTSPNLYIKEKGICVDNYFSDDDTKTVISHDVYIGANAIIMAGVNVGQGAVIGAGSIVMEDVPPYSVVVGIPGQVIKYRFAKTTIESILEKKIFDSDVNSIVEFNHDFNTDR